jgi:hypothetical protein
MIRDTAKNLDTPATLAGSGVVGRGVDLPLHDLSYRPQSGRKRVPLADLRNKEV